MDNCGPTAAITELVGVALGTAFANQHGVRAPDSQVAMAYVSAVAAKDIRDGTLVTFCRTWRWGEQNILGVLMET